MFRYSFHLTLFLFRKLIQKKRSRIGSSEDAAQATRRPEEEEPRSKRRLATRRRRHHAQAQGEDQFPAPLLQHWGEHEVLLLMVYCHPSLLPIPPAPTGPSLD